MKFKDNIYLLLSYTNASDIKTKYPNIKSIAIINIIGVILYFIIPSFLAKAIITILLIAVNYCFKEIRGIAITFTPVVICKLFLFIIYYYYYYLLLRAKRKKIYYYL